ncbi:hypothetical protein ACFYVR_18175 [Rhodococcus sp. NPDC003318]|uniref:hypothetical protein n=1 Tax=Rhodococcus sp. NPDC003318 TaxID=3364503 RepID=UPI0036CDCDEB
MPDRTAGVVAATCAAGLAAAVLVLGATNPPTPKAITTDRLGPDSGELVADYLARAAESLDGSSQETSWGLVAFDTEVTATAADDLTGDVPISQLWFRVPVERVQTPIVAVGVAGAESIARAPGYAAARLYGTTGEWDRQGRIDAVSAYRLAQDCACVVGATVRGPQSELAALAEVPGVRAVEALPADAVFGRFAVRPLLPEQTVAVTPGPDDGEVPER